jgi:hypothetical protein
MSKRRRNRSQHTSKYGTVYRNDGPSSKRITFEQDGEVILFKQNHNSNKNKQRPKKHSFKIVEPEKFYEISDTIFSGKYYCVGDDV